MNFLEPKACFWSSSSGESAASCGHIEGDPYQLMYLDGSLKFYEVLLQVVISIGSFPTERERVGLPTTTVEPQQRNSAETRRFCCSSALRSPDYNEQILGVLQISS